MTDRELLEAAAKAAGLRLEGDHYWHDGASQWVRWNPLTDDGDALRLAVKLRLTSPLTWPDVSIEASEQWAKSGVGVDWYAATRRAIVRAAAEIGKDAK